MTNNQGRATSLLQHYLRLAVTASGQRWDSDNNAEVAEIVDGIIAAATATPARPAETDAKSDWIELRDGWVRASDVYRIHTSRNGDLIAYLRSQDDGIVIDADDPALGDVLFAVGIHTDR